MKKFWHHIFLMISILLIASCAREELEMERGHLPDGTPITMLLDFGAAQLNDVWLGTKAEANRADETTVRDIYVMIFDKNTGDCFYSNYFAYQHLQATREALVSQPNEGWFVDNLTLQELANGSSKKTRGVVKISTESRSNCRLVLLANIRNTVMSLNGESQPEKYLERTIHTWEDFNKIEVRLAQDLTLRDDLFLMMGRIDVENTGDMAWDKTYGSSTGNYGEDYKVVLKPLDAKVKFRIRANNTNIQSINPRLWRVCRVPRRSFLSDDSSITSDRVPDDNEGYFDTADFYFEGTERDDDGTWEVFSFYMLQNRQLFNNSVTIPDEDLPANCDLTSDKNNYRYHRREFKEKSGTGDNLKNEDWYFARHNATYVEFDLILNLTEAGINAIDNHIAEALTTDAKFTVHLGDFNGSETADYDDYNTLRGYSYTYNIVVNNSKSIYVEVLGDGDGENRAENEPGQEGSLLLTTDGIINCDAHYEYHSMVFKYSEELGDTSGNSPGGHQNRSTLSWHIKSPFHENGIGPSEMDANGWYIMPEDCDARWVMFKLNEEDGSGNYKTTRQPYPGPGTDLDPTYKPGWTPSSGYPVPTLLDINQLVNLLFWQNEIEHDAPGTSLFDNTKQIRVTAFVNEYYYEVDPITGKLDQDLWRKFVNAKPRELHILSDANRSRDGESDVITSSHSIVQQSIQTIYNIYSPSLSSIWGTEHNDKIHKGAEDIGWPWWPSGTPVPSGSLLYNDEENGRLNTAGLWGLTTGLAPQWGTYLNYNVDNDMPELRSEYQYLAYACMSRNRDNNGNGKIDMDEVRWYTGAINQLVGMWVGNEALTQTARLYQPKDATSQDGVQWRSEVVSSTVSAIANPRVIRSEEGGTKSSYNQYTFWTEDPIEHQKVSSIRCLRNVGTYREMGVPTDITYAPVDMMVDQYYECAQGVDPNGNAWPNDDGTYTITFSNLNNKSIREYTDKDLPYHDEYSLHNCVYLSFTAMNKDDDITPAGVTKSLEVLNDEVSVHNNVCPEGYRLPNMTELLLMSALLPENYWYDDSGTKIVTNYPCRTYFSYGYLAGSNLKQKTTEKNKIGWGYYTQASGWRVHLKDKGNIKFNIRCVQDDRSMRGDITGDIVVDNWNHLERGDNLMMKLNFSSVGAAINYVDLKLHYTDTYGNQRTKPIPYTLVHSSTVIKDDEFQDYGKTILNELPAGVYGQMSIHATLRNTYGTEREFETPIRLESDLKLSIRLLPLQYNAAQTDPQFPLLVTAYNVDSNHIVSWNLKRTTPSGSYDQNLELPDYGDSDVTYASRIVYFDNPGSSLQEGTYTFQLEATDNAGNITRSDIVSMEVLKVYYCPYTPAEISRINDSANQGSKPDYYTDETKIKRWKRQMIQGLDFPSGDFIEANIDITNCIHIPFGDAGITSDDLGFDKIVTIGLNSTDWATNQFNVFYPSCTTSTDDSPTWLYFQPTWTVGTGVGYRGYDYSVIDSDNPLHLRLDKNGVHWNGNLVDIRKWPAGDLANIRNTFEKLMNAHTLFIGSTEGNPSRATYRFVRVVYNGRDSAIRGGNDTFDQNPINGGKL